MATESEQRDGLLWVRKTVREIREVFKFWGVATIHRIIQSLVEKQYVIVGDFDDGPGKGAQWLTFNFEQLQRLKSIRVDCSTMEQPMFQNDPDSSQNGTTVLIKKREKEYKPASRKEKELSFRISDVEDPIITDPDGSLREGLKRLYPQFDFDLMYGKWWRSKVQKRGIGRRAGAAATIPEYRASVENYFQSCSENSQNGFHSNGNNNGKLPAVKITTAEDIERMMRPT